MKGDERGTLFRCSPRLSDVTTLCRGVSLHAEDDLSAGLGDLGFTMKLCSWLGTIEYCILSVVYFIQVK